MVEGLSMIKISVETIGSMYKNVEKPESILERMIQENPALAIFIMKYCLDAPPGCFAYLSVLSTGIYKIIEKQYEVDELNKQFEN